MKIYSDKKGEHLGKVVCDGCGNSISNPSLDTKYVTAALRKMGWRSLSVVREKKPVFVDLCPKCKQNMVICPHCNGLTDDAKLASEFRCRNCRRWIGNSRSKYKAIPIFRPIKGFKKPYRIMMPGITPMIYHIWHHEIAALLGPHERISFARFDRYLKTKPGQIAIAKKLQIKYRDSFNTDIEPLVSDYLGIDWESWNEDENEGRDE